MRQPVVFFGHGNPMNAIETNAYTTAWSSLGEALPRPRAIVAISAHWYVPATLVTENEYPRTIHDFGGFPRELYAVDYPAPGDRGLAGRITKMLARFGATGDEGWGSITARGRCSRTSIPMPTCRSCSSASTKRSSPLCTSKSVRCYARCATKAL